MRGPETNDLPHSPAAERNAAPIIEALRDVLPSSGVLLEIASGTGQHAVRFARAFPGLTVQPSDADPERVAAIATRIENAGLPHLRKPLVLDVTVRPWPVERPDAVACINMVHISPWEATLALLDGAGSVLPPGGPLVLYGPFIREGVETAPSNLAFDRDLKRRDPRWGLRDLGLVATEARGRGFGDPDVREMPANNLAVTFRRARQV